MNTEQAEQQLLHISQERLLAFVRAMIMETGDGRMKSILYPTALGIR
jgi:hypothetical protein